MNKDILERFINKYNLSGTAESVLWESTKSGVSTRFISDDRHVIGEISTPDITLDSGLYAIYETVHCRGQLGVLTDTISISVNKLNGTPVSLEFKDTDGTKSTVVLAEPSNIPVVPPLKQLPSTYDIVIDIDKSFIEKFVKAKNSSALSDVETFTVLSDGKSARIVIGYSNNSTNRTELSIKTIETTKIDPVDFHARYMKEILVANKECKSGKLEISTEGIARITFEIDDFKAVYYLPAIERED